MEIDNPMEDGLGALSVLILNSFLFHSALSPGCAVPPLSQALETWTACCMIKTARNFSYAVMYCALF